MNFVIRDDGELRFSETLVLGEGLRIGSTALGYPELLPAESGEALLAPSGGDDTAALQALLSAGGRVRLAAGTFTLTAPVVLPAGTVLAGSGADVTTVNAAHNGNGVQAEPAAGAVGVEDLSLVGPGKTVGSGTGISVERGPAQAAYRVRVRGVDVTGFAVHGIYVHNTVGVDIDGVTVRQVGAHGFRFFNGFGETGQVRVSNLLVNDADVGVSLQLCWTSDLSNVRVVAAATTGVLLHGGVGNTLRGARITGGAGTGIHVLTGTLVTLEGCLVQGGTNGFRVENARETHTGACRSLSVSSNPLVIHQGASHVVDGFHADQLSSASAQPHLVVSGNASHVLLPVFRISNPTGGPPPIEADVSAAGTRVVFIQNNLDPARVNSGGKYVQL